MGGNVPRLIAYGRVSPSGLFSWAPGKSLHTSWDELDAGPVAEYGTPKLRAKYFFDAPFTKYGRMDPLCKVAVAAAQLAYKTSNDLAGFDRDEVAQVGGTMLGCLEVDAQFEAYLARLADLAGAAWVELADVAARAEALRSPGEIGDRPDLVAQEDDGDGQQDDADADHP